MHVHRRIGSALNGRFRKSLFAFCASVATVAAFSALPATGAAAATTQAAAPAVSGLASAAAAPASVCSVAPNPGEEFDRCTGTQWAATSCVQNRNYNVGNGPFNVLAAHNGCFVRVWLHQLVWNGSDWGNGWTKCISGGAENQSIDPQFQHPDNIYVSTNSSPC